MVRQPPQKAPMSLRRNRSYVADEIGFRKRCQKAQSNQRRSSKATRLKIAIGWRDYLIKILHLVAQLSADAAHKQVAERWDDSRPVLYFAVGLSKGT
jgi:hypothetical protein